MLLTDSPILGLHERVIDGKLRHALNILHTTQGTEALTLRLDVGDSHTPLAQHVALALHRALALVGENGGDANERLARQITLCNKLLTLLAEGTVEPTQSLLLDSAAEQLLALLPAQSPAPARPQTPLALGALLTGTRLDPSLVSQLRRELASADQVDILCSFIKWSGIRLLQSELEAFTARSDARLRVITTSYMGATDDKAVEFLRALPRTQIRLSYDTRRTRLHAKAYLFHRRSGFGAAYVGSANLSEAALTDGLEWNVKLSQYESAHLWDKVTATFDTYWNDDEFTPYTAAADHDRLCRALAAERQHGATGADDLPAFYFAIRPYPYQQEVLDKLEAERTFHDRHRNLVVAATGTGKTVMAALDYQRFAAGSTANQRPGLLFVAHREEILRQSLACFRAVLRDQNFGDLLVGGREPDSHHHLFVSIQSYHSRRLAERFPANTWAYVVVDEFHHAEAATYQKLLRNLPPDTELLGLTATPERGDGQDLLHHFGGHISAEIRLPTAIHRKLLCPFQYFGISDSVDLSSIAWKRGAYDPAALDAAFTGNDSRAALVVQRVHDLLTDPRTARGLGFCVSVAHARYMAAFFTRAGIPAAALSAETPPAERHAAQARLRDRTINFLFVVDLYNEGVDIPEIDTILFLRPTESLTIFLQQLGRGLRLSPGKECLTVLDFIGHAHRSFRFEQRFRALLHDPARRTDQEIEAGFPHLPAGCAIRLERIAQRHVLDNIRAAYTAASAGNLAKRLASFTAETGEAPTYERFLQYYEMTPSDLYRRDRTWTRLCREAGVATDLPATDTPEPEESHLAKGLRRLAPVSGPLQITRLRALLAPDTPPSVPVAETDQRLLSMLAPRSSPKRIVPGASRRDCGASGKVPLTSPRFAPSLRTSTSVSPRSRRRSASRIPHPWNSTPRTPAPKFSPQLNSGTCHRKTHRRSVKGSATSRT